MLAVSFTHTKAKPMLGGAHNVFRRTRSVYYRDHPLAFESSCSCTEPFLIFSFVFIRSIPCVAHYGNIFSLANIIKISPDELHLDHISCLATLVPNVLETKASHTDTCTHIHTGAQLHQWSMVDAWSRLSWGNLGCQWWCAGWSRPFQQSRTFLSVNKTNDWCNLQTNYSAESSAGINRLVMPYTFPNPCIFVY